MRIAVLGKRSYARNNNYYAAVEKLGAQTEEISSFETAYLVSEADGLILPGGVDLNPALYLEPNIDGRDINDALDALECMTMTVAVRRQIPILGICRGMQFINVFFGGTLVQNLEAAQVHNSIGLVDRVHETYALPGTFVERIYASAAAGGTYEHACRPEIRNTDTNIKGNSVPFTQAVYVKVNSAHHQCVDSLGRELKAAQFAVADNCVEAVFHTRLPIIGVQWHPERMSLANRRPDAADGLPVFEYFMEMCRDRRRITPERMKAPA